MAEFLNCELFVTLKEADILTRKWVYEYNVVRPHSALKYHPPAPQVLAFSA